MDPGSLTEEEWENLAVRASQFLTPAAPIDQRGLFAGRTSQIRDVLDVVAQRGQHAMLFGERGVGKTSLANVLSEFIAIIGESASLIAPRITCDTADTYSSVWHKVFSEIQFVMEKPRIGFGRERQREVGSAIQMVGEEVRPDDVRRVLGVFSRDAVVVIIIDEFDRVLEEATNSLFSDTVKILSDHSVPATLVLVGIADSVDQLIENHESLERALAQIRMPRMSNEELEKILDNALKGLGMTATKTAIELIVGLSRGLPHYTHLIGLHAFRAAIDKRSLEVTERDATQGLGRAAEGAQQSIRSKYHQATSTQREDSIYRQVLLSCALAKTDDLGFFNPAAVTGPLEKILGRSCQIATFSRHLTDFIGERRGEVLQRIGVPRRYRFRFRNPLMQPYVIMRGLREGMISKEAFREALLQAASSTS